VHDEHGFVARLLRPVSQSLETVAGIEPAVSPAVEREVAPEVSSIEISVPTVPTVDEASIPMLSDAVETLAEADDFETATALTSSGRRSSSRYRRP
jgi:hypothetical protein